MSRPPYPPYPPFPPYPPHASPPPYPPYPPYPPVQIGGVSGGSLPGLPGSAGGTGVGPGPAPGPGPGPAPGPGPGPGSDASTPSIPSPLSIFFNYGRYDIVDTTVEGVGQNQNAKVAKFVADATAARANQIVVTGFASPEDNLTTTLPLHRAQRLKNTLDQLFAAGAVRPTITVGPTGVLNGAPSTYPSLRRADASVVS